MSGPEEREEVGCIKQLVDSYLRLLLIKRKYLIPTFSFPITGHFGVGLTVGACPTDTPAFHLPRLL